MDASQVLVASGVTVVIPAYNYEKYLGEAVDSALSQDYASNIEVLIIDDGSTDRTGEIALSYGSRVRYHRKINAGLSAARNTGMELAQYDKVLFLDADDVLEPSCVRRLMQTWNETHPSPVVIGSSGRMINAEGSFHIDPENLAEISKLQILKTRDFVLRNRFSPIVLADRHILLSLQGFDTALRASEDRDMWIRASTMGQVIKLHECLHRKRDHGSNMSRQAEQQTSCIFQVLKKAQSNPSIQLEITDWREAHAVCFYQSALMHLAAGDRRMAWKQCLRSIATSPWLRSCQAIELPVCVRQKFLLLLLFARLRDI